MIEAIKRAAKDAVEASNPVAVMLGTVTKTSPLEVNVDQRFTLDADFLIVPETLTPYAIYIGGVEYIIRRGLEAGDGVILLRMQGGQRYLILDRAVNA